MPKQQSKPVTAAKQKKVRDWLRQNKHAKTKVDTLKIDTDENLKATLLELHGVTPEQLAQAER